MKSLGRRLAIPTLLFLALLAGGALALNAWTADDLVPVPAAIAVPQQGEGDGGIGIGILSDADESDTPSSIDGGIDDAVSTDMAEVDAAPLFDAADLFFDAPDPPGGPPGT